MVLGDVCICSGIWYVGCVYGVVCVSISVGQCIWCWCVMCVIICVGQCIWCWWVWPYAAFVHKVQGRFLAVRGISSTRTLSSVMLIH